MSSNARNHISTRLNTGRNRRVAALAAGSILALTLGACTVELEFGQLEIKTYEVEPFDRIDIGGAFDADVTVGDTTEVVIETGENIHDNLDVRVDDGELKIDLDAVSILGDGPMNITIVTPELVGLQVSGASDVEIAGVDAMDFDLDVSGASNVEIEGSISKLGLDASGASNVDLDDVDIDQADVDVSGASNVDMDSVSEVTGGASGASTISVDPDASVSVGTSGASSIDR